MVRVRIRIRVKFRHRVRIRVPFRPITVHSAVPFRSVPEIIPTPRVRYRTTEAAVVVFT